MIPVYVKAGGLALLLWAWLRGERKAKVDAGPVTTPTKGASMAAVWSPPTVGKRWIPATPDGSTTFTERQGDLEANYDPLSGKLIAVVRVSTYAYPPGDAVVTHVPPHVPSNLALTLPEPE